MALLGIPVAVGGGLILAAVGWWVAVQLGGEARGGVARLDFEAECGLAAQGAMLDRLGDYGLEARVVAPPLGLEVRMPGLDDDLEHMPRALTAPGSFEVWVAGERVADHFENAGVQIGLKGNPVTLVTLADAVSPDGLEVRISGEVVPIAQVNGTELQIEATADTPQRAMRKATDWTVAIRHPLPCPVRVTAARWVD